MKSLEDSSLDSKLPRLYFHKKRFAVQFCMSPSVVDRFYSILQNKICRQLKDSYKTIQNVQTFTIAQDGKHDDHGIYSIFWVILKYLMQNQNNSLLGEKKKVKQYAVPGRLFPEEQRAI